MVDLIANWRYTVRQLALATAGVAVILMFMMRTPAAFLIVMLVGAAVSSIAVVGLLLFRYGSIVTNDAANIDGLISRLVGLTLVFWFLLIVEAAIVVNVR